MPIETAETKEDGTPILYQLGIDSKYGKVFVEIPPPSLAKLLEEGKEYEACERYGNEPLFILRGTDPATPATIDIYGGHARETGTSYQFNEKVLDRADEIREWQHENKDFVKVAD